MSTIRPYSPPAAAPLRGREVARPTAETSPVRAAQRAFFQAALDTAPEQPRAKGPEPRRVEPRPVDRLPRPGSLLDIKV